MTEISIAGEIFNVLIEGDENKSGLDAFESAWHQSPLLGPSTPRLAQAFQGRAL